MGQLVFQATLGGQVNLVGPNTASTFNLNVPAVAGNLITSGDTGTVTNTMLAGSIANAKLTNSSVTVGSTSIALGATSTTLDGVNIGATTAGTGAFTTLSASSTVSGTGFSTYLASPPAIGGTAAAAGTFTTLTGSTSVTTPIVKSASSLTLQSNGTTTAVTIDTSQNVGIGTTSPSNKLAVSQTVSGADAKVRFFNTATAASSGSVIDLSNDGDLKSGWRYNNNTGDTDFGNLLGAYNLKFYTNATERMRIDASARVLVGTTSTFGNGGLLQVDSTASGFNGINVKCASANYAGIFSTASQFLYFTLSGGAPVGTVTYNGTITVYGTTSDRRLKENIVDAPSAFDFINSLKIRSFDWKESGKHHKFGVIAQELVEVSEECVSVPQKEEDIWQVDTSPLIPALAKAVQELKAINDTQAETINALTARVVALEAK
jgi:hypothetical protein